MRRRLLLVALTLVLSVSSRRACGEESPAVLWGRLGSPKDPGHAAAVQSWKALAPAERLARIRAGIRSEDPAVARLAAALADPDALDLEEIHRVMEICAADPAWVADPMRTLFGDVSSNGMGFGIPDMVEICRTAATTPGFAFAVTERRVGDQVRVHDPSDEFHRAMDVSIAEPLIGLLETRNSVVAGRLAHWLLSIIAVNTTRNETRPMLAKAGLYVRARADAEAAGETVSPLASFEAKADGPGIPPAAKALLRGELADAKENGRGYPDPWLLRWLWDVSPVLVDLTFLQEVSRAESSIPAYAAWAVRALAALDPEGTKTGWKHLAEGRDEIAIAAASELARRGAPQRLRALEDAAGERAGRAAVHAWETDPEDARRRWVATAATAMPAGLVDLRPAARARYELEYGVRIRDDDVAALGTVLTEGEAPKRGAAWFHGTVLQHAVTPEIAKAMAKRLAALPEDRYAGEDPDAEDLEATLACLEVRAPEVLRGLLAGWVQRGGKDRRADALRFLARIGDTRFVEPMLASWAEDEGWSVDAHVLGRVRDPRVTEFLKRKATEPNGGSVSEACIALAVSLGLPDDVRWSLYPSHGEGESYETEPYETARRLLLAGDGEGALAAVAQGGVVHLGALRTEKALARLRQVRAERLVNGVPAYWTATAELAVAGDAAARAEWRRFVHDGRVRMLDGSSGGDRLLLADPATVVDWIPHLDANCCLGFHAWSTLQTAFPTCPVEKIGPVMTRNRVAFERWYAAHQGTFVWSRIVDGWVPGPRGR